MEQPDRLKKFILQDGNPIQKIWDTSSLSSFASCPRMYNWTNLQGYKSKVYGMATGFGSAVHEGFEVLDMQKFNGATKDEAVAAAINYVLLEFGEALNQSEDKARGLTAALRAVTWRGEEYWDDLFDAADIRTKFEDNIENALKKAGAISLTMKINKSLTKEVG